MRIISWKTLRLFWERSQYTDAEQALKAWFREASSADWATPSEIKAEFGTASIVGNNRVVFNICGKKYRLVVRVNYAFRVMHRGRGMNMEIKPIKNECDYRKALKEIDSLMGAAEHARGRSTRCAGHSGSSMGGKALADRFAGSCRRYPVCNGASRSFTTRS